MSPEAIEVDVTRTLVVHCLDWPITAAGVGIDEPAVVLRANRVLASSPAARAAGISTGLRRREAQRRCPHVTVLEHDPDRDARAFEAAAAALDVITPRVEMTRPGTLAFVTRGPSRYFGGDDSLAERTGWIVAGAVGAGATVGVGVADGAFAALLAARRALHRADGAARASVVGSGAGLAVGCGGFTATLVVPPGTSPSFLAPIPVEALGEAHVPPELTDVWRRLGLRTLGQSAELPVADVLARFGTDGVVAHRLASGLDPRPLDARRPAPELSVFREIDPPAERVDLAAFVAKSLADELHAKLAADGLACTHVLVEAETEHGETLARHWRHEGALTAGALVDRVRWQLDGWLTGSASMAPTAGISRLALVPMEVVAATGRQLGFWGGETLVDERVLRAVARVQGTLGVEAVTVPEVRGGRSPAERVVRVPVAAVDLTAPRPAARVTHVREPWPGRVPAPAPASVPVDPAPVDVVDAAGRPVGVTGRGEVSAPLARLTRAGQRPVAITAWAGPWPVDERWWDRGRHRRRARFQVVEEGGIAHLLSVEAGRWWLEATYD